MLHAAGAITVVGSVERGTTVCDFDPLEKQHQHSLYSAVAHFDHDGTRVHMIDTPGYPDFHGQAIASLEAVETAVIVVNAQTGIELTTTRMMNWARQRGLCRLLVINKIDADNVDLPALLKQLQEAFGKECLPINLPAAGGSKVVDCFFNPGGEADFSSVAEAHGALIDQVVEVNEELMARYLEQGDIDAHELHEPFEQALREGHLVPICFTSARTGAGVRELLDVFEHLLPTPAEGNPPQFLKGEGAQAVPYATTPDPSKHVVAHVFKVSVDPFVGKLGVFRVHQGTVTRDSQLFVGDGRKPFKVGQLYMLRGKEYVPVDRCLPGDIGAVAKVEEIVYDSVLHDSHDEDHIHLGPIEFPLPIFGLAIEPSKRGDEQRLWEIMQKLSSEDPCLKIEHVAGTNETVIQGLGELHVRILLEKMGTQYKLEVKTHPPRIAYRETITAAAEGHSRHKKQTGGAGQFGEVLLRIEPLPRGTGFEFGDDVKGGVIPNQYIPAVEKGVHAGDRARRHRRLSVAGRASLRLRRQIASGRFEGSGVRGGWPQGLPGCGAEGAADRAGADRQCPDQRARALHRRHHRRHLLEARPGERHAAAAGRAHRRDRPGPALGDQRLRIAAQVHHRRPGLIQRRVQPLRAGPAQRPAAARGSAQGASARGIAVRSNERPPGRAHVLATCAASRPHPLSLDGRGGVASRVEGCARLCGRIPAKRGPCSALRRPLSLDGRGQGAPAASP